VHSTLRQAAFEPGTKTCRDRADCRRAERRRQARDGDILLRRRVLGQRRDGGLGVVGRLDQRRRQNALETLA
jgi:hypothetical protein